MGKKIINIRWIKKNKPVTLMAYDGSVHNFNQYEEFNKYIEQYKNTPFAQHYQLFKNQIGVYRFNLYDQCLYVGYSQNLIERVRESFFNHGFLREYIEFQYILCDSKEHAESVESYYVNTLKPKNNIAGKRKQLKPFPEIIPDFCNPMLINFNNYWKGKQ